MYCFTLSWDYIIPSMRQTSHPINISAWMHRSGSPILESGALTINFWNPDPTLTAEEAATFTLGMISHMGGSHENRVGVISAMLYADGMKFLQNSMLPPDLKDLAARIDMDTVSFWEGTDPNSLGHLHVGENTTTGTGLLEGTWDTLSFFTPIQQTYQIKDWSTYNFHSLLNVNGCAFALGMAQIWGLQKQGPLTYHSDPYEGLDLPLTLAIEAFLEKGLEFGFPMDSNCQAILFGGAHTPLAKAFQIRTRLRSPGQRQDLAKDLCAALLQGLRHYRLIIGDKSPAPDKWVLNGRQELRKLLGDYPTKVLMDHGAAFANANAPTLRETPMRIALHEALHELSSQS